MIPRGWRGAPAAVRRIELSSNPGYSTGAVTLDRFSARKAGRQSRARETIDAILEASARLVYGSGATPLTTNRIAELAGVSIGSLYQYFPGKDAVLHALIEREFNKTVDGHLRHIASIDTGRVSLEEAVASIVDHVFEGQHRRRPLYRHLMMSVLSIRHLRFTLENDTRVLIAVRDKLAEYGRVDTESLETSTYVALYALKGLQIGVVLSDRPADEGLRAAISRAIVACVAPPTGSKPGTD